MIDPQLTRGDRLVGQVLGSKGSLPEIYTEIEVNYFLLRRLLGVRSDDKKQTKVAKLAKNEILMVNMCVPIIGSARVSDSQTVACRFLDRSSFRMSPFTAVLRPRAVVSCPSRATWLAST